MSDETKPVEAIREALERLMEPGAVHELRILNAGKHRTVSGYFDDLDALAAAAAAWDGRAAGLYLTLNPVDPKLLARAANRARTYAEATTGDADVLRRTRLMIDLDPVRPSGIASTDAEHEAALERARLIRGELGSCGWPAPLLVDSGNGARLDYRIDLPNDAEALALVKAALAAIQFRYADDVGGVDTSVGNAARIARIPGSLNAKGDNTKERPHRRCLLLEAPAALEVVPRELLEALAASTPKTEAARGGSAGVPRGDFDLERWIAEHADRLEVLRSGPWQAGRRWLLRVCPFDEAHIGGSSAILEHASGAAIFRCLHAGCAGRGWRDLRELLEPTASRPRSQHTAASAEGARAARAEEREADPALELDGMLRDVRALLLRFVAFGSTHQSVAVTLWAALTHVFAQFETTPYLAITSPEKRSGKTRLLDVLELVVARGWRAVLPSEAVVFRKIARDKPTLLLDEVDAIYGPKAREHEGLRAILNAGHRRGASVPRCVGEGMELRDFSVYCPKALAGIGALPDTVEDRSIPIRLQRRRAAETVERFRFRDAAKDGSAIRSRLAAWADKADLSAATPPIPEALNDRAADGWEPLLALADVAGGDWPQLAREAAEALHGEADVRDETLGVRLLGDVRDTFGSLGDPPTLFTSRLVEALRGLDEAPWADLRGKPLSARVLARLLRGFGVRPASVRVGESTGKGYRRTDFSETWERYLPPPAPTPPSGSDPSQRHNGADSSTCAESNPSHEWGSEGHPSHENRENNQDVIGVCDPVTDRNAGNGSGAAEDDDGSRWSASDWQALEAHVGRLLADGLDDASALAQARELVSAARAARPALEHEQAELEFVERDA